MRNCTRMAWIGILGTCLCACAAIAAEDSVRRSNYLTQLWRVLPPSDPWDEWLSRTHELPPDFATMPSIPLLPDPLVREEGTPRAARIASPEQWPGRREEILRELQQYVLGTTPPPPENFEARVLTETEEPRALVREVELSFGPENKAKTWLRLYLPKRPGPFPVFLTQENHEDWALIALRRGYAACIFAGSDSRDDTGTFLDAFPGYDWSLLTRRAWAASRCIDYLITLPEVDRARIAMTGHSRNGKQSLIAAALDERIAVVISSSSGVGGAIPSRYCSEQHFGEGIQNITGVFPDWFHPRWRFFVGREDKLPIDLHSLVALSAPRPCLLSIAFNDGVENAWAMQQGYLSVRETYRLLGAPDNLRILWRSGGHETWPAVIERYLDWCDLHFGRGDYTFEERFVYPWDWSAWAARDSWRPHLNVEAAHAIEDALRAGDGAPVASIAEWEKKAVEVRNAVLEILGEAPPGAAGTIGHYGGDVEHVESMLGRDTEPRGVMRENHVFGEYLNGNLYIPEFMPAGDRRLPAVLWLHPWHPAKGYAASYKRGEHFYIVAARLGFATFCYDQIGCGRRVEEVEHFYDRYPKGSLLGAMVRDAQAALTAMTDLPQVNPNRIYVVGYGLGAMVAQHLAALDDRPAGYAIIAGPQPFRLDTEDKPLGGIARWSRLLMLLPRLGHYVGNELYVPYDAHLLIASMAPRPVCVVTPLLDREVVHDDVTRAVESARQIYELYGASDSLTHVSPETYNHFGPEMHAIVLEWLQRLTRPQAGS